MATVVDEIATFLAAEGLGTVGATSGWSIFKHFLPPGPDTAIAVIETGGSGPDEGFGAATARFENPAVQLVFRGAPGDYDSPRAKAKTAVASMIGVEAPQTLSGTVYNIVTALQAPFPMGAPDAERRYRIAVNFAIEKELSA